MFCVWYSVLVTLVLQTVDCTDWPRGKYALLKPTTGCPDGWQDKGWLLQDTEDNNPRNNRSEILNIDGHVSPSYVIKSFCVKTIAGQGSNWPIGRYCLYRKRERKARDSLLPGMFGGWIKMDDDKRDSSNKDIAIYTSYYDWIFYSLSPKYKHLVLYFQCKTDGNTKTPIELPITKPFYLLPYGSRDCQQVKWMVAITEWIKYDLNNPSKISSSSGAKPFFRITKDSKNNKDIIMYYCYYRSCNYTLTETKGVLQSPGFPGKYPDGQLCSWRIMVPANHTVHVRFTNFSLYDNDTKDFLESYENINGTFELTNTSHGFKKPFTLTSTTDLLFKFVSNEANNALGFRAEYTTLIPAEATQIRPSPTSGSTGSTTTTSNANALSTTTATESPSNNRIAFAFENECGGIGTTAVIVIVLICSLFIVAAVVFAGVYRYRSGRTSKQEKDKERTNDTEAMNPTYDRGDIFLNPRASTATVVTTTDEDDGQMYETLSRDQNKRTDKMNTKLSVDNNGGPMYQILSREQQPEYESPDYSKHNGNMDPNMDPGYPEYHELEPMDNNVPDVVYDVLEGPDPNNGPSGTSSDQMCQGLDNLTTHNPLYESANSATTVTPNHL